MEIKKEYYPELVEDKGTRVLTPYLEIKTNEAGRVGKIIATDGRIMVVIAVSVTPDDFEGWIPNAVFKAARKAMSKRADCVRIVCGEKAFELADCSTIARVENDRRLPNWRAITDQNNSIRPPVHTATFDPEMLLTLAKTIGAKSSATGGFKVTVEFQANGKPMIVKGDIGQEIEFSMMMPMKLSRT